MHGAEQQHRCCCSQAFLRNLQLLQLLAKLFALHVQVLFVVSKPANESGVVPATTSRYHH